MRIEKIFPEHVEKRDPAPMFRVKGKTP